MTKSSAFDKSSYVVVPSSQQRHRRRTGSFGEAPVRLTKAVSSTEWDFQANFDDSNLVQDHTVVMMEPYQNSTIPPKRLTGKDFMDGSDFLHSTNVFRDAQQWHSDDIEEPFHSFEESHGLEKLIQELRISLGPPTQQHDENTKPRTHAFVKDSAGTEPTTFSTEPTMSPPRSLKRKKKHKKKKRHSKLPSVVPPDHVIVDDHETVASSVGGLTAFACQEKIQTLLTTGRYTIDNEDKHRLPSQALYSTGQATATRDGRPREVDISAPLTVASSVGQESGWVMKCTTPAHIKRQKPREIDISALMTVQSSLDGESSFRPRSKPLDLEKVTRNSTMEIQVPTTGEHTVVSSLGESMGDRRGYRPLQNHPNVGNYRDSTFHQLYRSNDSRDY
jgi:hypothetical protein